MTGRLSPRLFLAGDNGEKFAGWPNETFIWGTIPFPLSEGSGPNNASEQTQFEYLIWDARG